MSAFNSCIVCVVVSLIILIQVIYVISCSILQIHFSNVLAAILIINTACSHDNFAAVLLPDLLNLHDLRD